MSQLASLLPWHTPSLQALTRGAEDTESICATELLTKILTCLYFPEVLKISLQASFCTLDVLGRIERFASGPVGISELGKDVTGCNLGKAWGGSFVLSSLFVCV